MKTQKLLAAMTTGAMAISMMAVSASAIAEEPVDPIDPIEENVKVLYDAPLTEAEFSLYDLGKGIEGAKLRFTYTSNQEIGYGAVGIAAKSIDWDWLQSENNPALGSAGEGIETSVEMTYNEFVSKADIDPDVELRCYVFMDWGLEAETNFKLELVTPVEYNVAVELYNGKLDNTELTPAELGRDIEGSKVRISYTAVSPEGWGAIGLAGLDKTWTWQSAGAALNSKGENKLAEITLPYADFVTMVGIGDDLEYFVFQDWGLDGSDCKIELIIPTTEDATEVKVLLNEKNEDLATDAELTLVQLGKNIPGSKIRVTYSAFVEEDATIVGICGKNTKIEDGWYTGVNSLAAVELNDDGNYVYEDTYANFVDFAGIVSDEITVDRYVFQNWSETDVECTIELIIPVS